MPLSKAAAKQKPRQSREDDCCGTARDANPFSPSLPYFRVLVLTGVWSCTGHRRDAWDTKKRMVMRSTGVCSHEAKHDVWSFPHHHPSCQGRDGIWHTRSTDHGDFSFESQMTTSRVSPLTSQRTIFSAGSACLTASLTTLATAILFYTLRASHLRCLSHRLKRTQLSRNGRGITRNLSRSRRHPSCLFKVRVNQTWGSQYPDKFHQQQLIFQL